MGSYWNDIFLVSSSDGKITIYSPDCTKRVEMGADSGFSVYLNGDLVGGLDSEGNSIASKLFVIISNINMLLEIKFCRNLIL
jgi:hypothetical protein